MGFVILSAAEGSALSETQGQCAFALRFAEFTLERSEGLKADPSAEFILSEAKDSG